MTDSTEEELAEDPLLFAQFLEGTPPLHKEYLPDLFTKRPNTIPEVYDLSTPELQLHCSSESCNGARFFRNTNAFGHRSSERAEYLYLVYQCSNCREEEKVFALGVKRTGYTTEGEAVKVGELPPYGPSTPARLISLIGPDRAAFLSGRRCENRGLGIGAFAYYRRVVENQKDRILDEVIRVSEKLAVPAATIDELRAAKAETQFSSAMSKAKDALPQALLINGQNPLSLLHSALSRGIHELADEDCLEIAASIRVVLAELSERLASLLKDEAELRGAVARLSRPPDAS